MNDSHHFDGVLFHSVQQQVLANGEGSKAIAYAIPSYANMWIGLQFSECLPKLSRVFDLLTLSPGALSNLQNLSDISSCTLRQSKFMA